MRSQFFGKRMFTVVLAGGLLAGGIVLSARADTDPDTLKVFKSKCAICHGADGKGQTTAGQKAAVKDWTDGKTLNGLTDAQIKERIKTGVKGDDGKQRMPANDKLTDDQVNALAAYVRTFQH